MSYSGFGTTFSMVSGSSASLGTKTSPFLTQRPASTRTVVPRLVTPVPVSPKLTRDPAVDAAFVQRDGVWYVGDQARSLAYGAMAMMTWVEAVPGPGMLYQGAAAPVVPGSLSMPVGDAVQKIQAYKSATNGLVLVERSPASGASIVVYFPADVSVAWPMVYGANAKFAVFDGTADALYGLGAAAKLASQGQGAGSCPTGQVMVDGKCIGVSPKCPVGFVMVDGVCVEVAKPSLCPTPPGGVPCPDPQMWDTSKCECVLPQDKQSQANVMGGETPKWVIPVVAGVGAIALIAVVVAATKKG